MANDMTIFTNARPAAAFASLGGEQMESLADGIGSSYAVVGYKGKVWSLRYRGEKHIFTRKDDGSPTSYIDVIVLRQGHTKSKSYYKSKEDGGGYDVDGSEGKRPICAALDGVTPDIDVLERQAEHCAVCPRNVWKTGTDGRKGRECTDYKRLAVLLLPGLSNALLGSPLLEPVFLRVPPASLNDLAALGEQMTDRGWHYSTFITRVSFDPNQSYPKMVFEAKQPLTDAEAPVVLPMRESALARRITGEDQHGEAVARISQVAPPLQLAATVAEPAATPVKSPPEQLSATAIQPATPTPAGKATASTASPSEPEGPIDTGFGLVGKTPEPQAAPKPTVVTAADTGEPVESDADLDARIKAIMLKNS